MSKIHYFQRYSSYENAVTNNFLQLLARIYDYSSAKASQFLTEIVGTNVEIGMEISQQTKGIGSIPDGALIQRSFKILVEAKVEAGVDVDQLIRHAKGFSGESQQILLLLAKHEVSGSEQSDIQKKVSVSNPGVMFHSTTYEKICKSVSELFVEREEEMVSLCSDFVEYCNDTGLFDQSRYFMRIVPCGASVDINKKYGIYFHPSDRGYTKHSYVGIYAQKSVQCIWKIDCVFDVTLEGDNLKKELIQGRDTEEYDEKILGVIAEAFTKCGYPIASGHRFFCGNPMPTNYKKTSYGGIQGARFENLRTTLGQEPGSVEEISVALRSRTWE